MRIIDNGVVHSILRGDATPRRTSRQLTTKDQQPQNPFGRRQGQQQTPSSGQQNKQVTVAPKARGQHTASANSANNPSLQPASSSLSTTSATAAPAKPATKEEKGNSRSSKSQATEKRKRRSDNPVSLAAESEPRSASPSKRGKSAGETDSEATSSPKEAVDSSASNSCPEGEARGDKTASKSKTSTPSSTPPATPSTASTTPVSDVPGSKDRTVGKSLRPKKGSNNNSSSLVPSPSVSEPNSSKVNVSVSSIVTSSVNTKTSESRRTPASVNSAKQEKKDKDCVSTASSSVVTPASPATTSTTTTLSASSTVTTVSSAAPSTVSAAATSLKSSPPPLAPASQPPSSGKKQPRARSEGRETQGKKGAKKSSEGESSKAATGSSRHGASRNSGPEHALSQHEAGKRPAEALSHGAGKVNTDSPATAAKKSQLSDPGKAVGLEEAEDTMHYKKQLLLAGGSNSPTSSTANSQSSPSSTFSASIDVNRSVTDQLTKLAKAEKIALGGGDGKIDTEHSLETSTSGTFSNSVHTPVSASSDPRTSEPDTKVYDPKVYDFMTERHREASAFTCVKGNASLCNTSSSLSEERAESRASDSQVSSGLGDDRRPGSRLDDLRSVKSSPTSSPLIVDRNEPVNIYRDPELMSKNPVRSGLSVAPMHKTMSGPTYPGVPGGLPAPPPGMTTSTTLASHPTSLARSMIPGLPYPPHQLPPGAMSHGLPVPHAFSQLDALAAREIAAAAQQQQHQQIAALQQQYQNAAQLMHSMPYSLQGGPGPRMSQLELLWQQKFPHVPVPPTWLLAKQPEALLGDALIQREQLERLEQERIERERIEKRLEIERLERDRADRAERERREKRDKLERERIERDKAEKAERERAERERMERERLDKERKERERILEQREWEQQQQRHQERERIHRESADTSAQAAVDEHFVESFRLAKLRGIAPTAWATPSITKGTGKGFIKMEAEKAQEEERMKREVDQRMMSEDKRYLASLHEQRGDLKSEFVMGKDGKPVYGYPPYHYGGGGYPHPSSNSSNPASKPEAIFSLYGYPSQHSTITTEQLQKKGLAPGGRPLKEEKGMYPSHRNSSPPQAASAHHLKDMKQQSSVIVENKVKMEKPVAAHSHHQSTLSSSSSSSPRPQPRPAHTPEQRPDRPLSSSAGLPSSALPHHMVGPSIPSSSSFMAQSPHPTAFRSLDPKSISRSQSPYKMGPSQPVPVSCPPPHSAGQPQPINFSSKSKGQSGSASPYPPAAIAQPPVSLPASTMAYSYSLIQQGLVPNPMYSQNTMPNTMHMARSQVNTGPQPATSAAPVHSPHNAGMCMPPSSSQAGKPPQLSPPGPGKRKNTSGRDNGSIQSSKRSKAATQVGATAVSDTGRTGGMASVPVTTPQILTNPSPYTTTSNNLANMSSRAAVPLAANAQQHVPSGFLDSFKSFVETTVQNAFLQDEKSSREKEERDRLQKQQEIKFQQQQQVTMVEKMDSTPTAVSREEVSPSPVAGVYSQPVTPGLPNSSMASIIDTINRVANGQDTDSDTLSAPSPPPQSRGENNASPQQRGATPSAPKLKKAWLQRHADDKKPSASPLVPSPLVIAQDDSNSSQSTSKEVKHFLKGSSGLDSSTASVNGDVTASPVPGSNVNSTNVTNVNLPNGNISSDLHNTNANDESTSSASETESQNTNTSAKKRSKSKKSNASSKRVKSEEKAPSPITAAESSSTTPNSARNKKPSSKRSKPEKPEKDSSKQKEKASSREPGSGSASPAPSSVSSQRSPAPQSSSTPSNNNSNTNINNSKKEEKPSKSSSSKPSPKPSRENNSPTPPPPPQPPIQDPEKSPASSSDSGQTLISKDKKKTRRSKEVAKDAVSKNGEQGSSFNKPLVKCSMATLKRTGAHFIQDGPCSEVTPKLSKCRECKMTPNQRSKKIPNIFCRFYAFRRLKYSTKGAVTIAGFSELSDADPDDIEPWLPRYPIEEPVLDDEMAKFILSKVGDKFCELVEQEKEAKSLPGVDPPIAWKRAVTGVREMCDVCDTTLFNMHWVCHKCGFVVCLDCYKAKIKASDGDDEDDCKWLTCSSNRQAHDARKLMLTQIIPSDALWELGRLIHDIRRKWSIPAKCPCGQNSVESKPAGKNGMNQQLVKKMVNGVGEEGSNKKSKKAAAAAAAAQQAEEEKAEGEEFNQDKLALLANVALGGGDKPSKRSKLEKLAAAEEEVGEDGDKKSSCSTLRELLTKTAGKGKVPNEKKSKPKTSGNTLDDIIQSVVEKSCRDMDQPNQTFKFLHYIPRLGQWNRELPIIAHNLTETSVLYPDVPHSWLCDGRLLRLHDPRHKGNLKIFQEQWKRGQPALVSCINKLTTRELWNPETFKKEFGQQENDLVNCRNGNVIMGNPMSDFWQGFESIDNRLLDEDDDPMLLKLKDWPPGDDFSELMPSRFNDLMQALPLPEYTRRNGKLNLASRLPDFLVRPDLGPKMYNAYGSAKFPKEGTTNLHLDISDAVNVLVYVGVPSDGPNGSKEHEEAALKAIDAAGCDSITKRRVREVHEVPGALWQIYDAHDADKIRDFLNKVAKERGEKIEADHDSIHDQSWYLDEELRDRLLKEYGVHGYTIVQCLGDAIFIPAGAPHQVRNLHSCVKVAEDFVSPEHLNHCFRLTQEFRQLSDTHSNHEDKLQVKNIIYHAVKDSIAVLRELEPDDKE
ncbi:probable JmjC domain-containing histone demethylation protein 2C isoform X2 [Littorina saxatilis]